MKSCLGILIVTLICVAVVGGGSLIWHMSNTSEFSRKSLPPKKKAPSDVPSASFQDRRRGLSVGGKQRWEEE